MSVSRRIRVLAVVVVLASLAAACGQKEGVHVGFSGGAGGGATGAGGDALAYGEEGLELGEGVDTDGDGVADTANTADAAGGAEGAAATGGNSSGGGGAATATGGNSSDGGGGGGNQTSTGGSSNGGTSTKKSGTNTGKSPSGKTGGGDSTGITADTIKIGVHAPLTGAAPIPQRSFFEGKDQYWNEIGELYGRKVEVVFRDDKYNPSAASQACQELILKEKVFMLAGSGGTDQIAECARIAAHYGVPYLSAGVTRVRLDRLPNYFAQSMSYTDQMPLLMQWIKKNKPPKNKRVGLIASNTANFDDAVSGFTTHAKKAGYTPYVYRPSKAPSDGELAGIASKMAGDGITVATPVMQPTAWIKMAKNAQLRGVQWAGVGVTMGLNSVANVVCPEAGGAMFFSPFPGFNLAKSMAPKFPGSDDIQWAQWGSNQSLHMIFKRMNGTLTREAFMQAMVGTLKPGIFNPTYHTQNDHFKVKSVHVLHLDCGSRQFVSQRSDLFRDSF